MNKQSPPNFRIAEMCQYCQYWDSRNGKCYRFGTTTRDDRHYDHMICDDYKQEG